jgi:parallel beta-helix repeat protein
MWYCNNSEIKNNNVYDNEEDGFVLRWSNYNNISDNTISDDPVNNPHRGIMIDVSHHNNILRNHIWDCLAGIQVDGEFNTIADNNISRNVDVGIWMEWYDYNTLENNLILNNYRGIIISESDFNDISNNVINYSNQYGLELHVSNYNNIVDNTFYCNRDGCWIEENCVGNTFANNICEPCPDGTTNGDRPVIPSYDVFLVLGILSLGTILLTRKKLKKKNK